MVPLVHSDIESLDPPNHDETVPRAQNDTGAFVSCTDQKHLLHDYISFNLSHPCPIRLIPATDGSDAVPIGYPK